MACEDPATCVAVSKTIMSLLVYGSGTGAFVLFIFIFILWKTPALEFLIASFTGKSVAYVTNRSQQGRFTTGKIDSGGMMDVRKVGPVLIAENSHTIERSSGRPLFFIFGEFASTLPIWWVEVINQVKAKFSKKQENINNVSDLGDKIGRKFDEKNGSWIDTTKKSTDDDVMFIEPYKSIKLHDLANMFPSLTLYPC